MVLLAKTFWAVLILIEVNNALKIHEECEGVEKCPDRSSCTWIGCLGRRCSCNNALLPNDNKTSCVDVVPLESTCNTSTACDGGPFSQCDYSRTVPVCVCLFGYIISNDKTMCIPILQGNTTAVGINGSCQTDPRLTCVYDLQCISGTCQCGNGTRLANVTELRAVPKSTELCRPTSFQLGKLVDLSSKECKKAQTETNTTEAIASSTTTTSTTTSTTTPTPTTTSTTTPTPTTTSTTTTTKTTTSTTTPTPTTTSTTTPTTTTTSTTTSTQTTTSTTTPSPTTTSTTTPTPTTTSTTTPTPTTTTTTTTPTPTTTSTTTPTQKTTTSTTTPTPPTTTSTTTPTPTTSTTTPTPTTTSTTTPTPTTPSTTTPIPTTTSTTTPKPTTTSTTTHTPTNISTTTSTHTTSTTYAETTTSTTTSTTTPTPTTTSTTTSTPTITSTDTDTTTTTGMSTSKVCECAENKECEIDTCREKQCRCVLGYAESPDGKTCNKLATLGETCSNQTICQGFNTRCTDSGVCDCADGFERSDNGRWCRLQSKFGIDFPLLGEKCNGGFFQDCYMFFEQTCIQGKCRCKGGLRDASPEDINTTFPDEIQCVEESFKQGHRKPQPCTNGTGRRSPIDTKMAYERAKSKIKRIQDIIIGSCVGSVALLGIIIGIVALIRWKRRGRENFMDTSSTASTDGQASRYSFKIPRPFAIGAKEYDSTHINYPNPIFAHHPDVDVSSQPQPDFAVVNRQRDVDVDSETLADKDHYSEISDLVKKTPDDADSVETLESTPGSSAVYATVIKRDENIL